MGAKCVYTITAAGRQPQHEGSEILTEWRRWAVIQRPARPGVVEGESAFGTGIVDAALPQLANVSAHLQAVVAGNLNNVAKDLEDVEWRLVVAPVVNLREAVGEVEHGQD